MTPLTPAMTPLTRQAVIAWLDDFALATRRWQARGDDGSLACPVARISHQWTEFFALPVAVDALRRRSGAERRALVLGLVDFLGAVQRPDGTFDAGFCGDLCQPCNAAFALRPLATALADWPADLDGARRQRLAEVLARAAAASADGGMNTANHRWVAAGGLAHAARVLGREDLGLAADAWTRAEIDIDADGAYSEGSPKYALVSNDAFLDLEALRGRSDLGALARRSLGYLRAVALPDGEFAAVGSVRYDTDGSTDGYARAAWVFARLGEHALARRGLAKLWGARSAPGLVAPHVYPPLGAPPKAKLYPSVVSAISADCLLRWSRVAEDPGTSEPQPVAERRDYLPGSGLFVYTAGRFALAAGPGPNLFEIQWGETVLEGARLLVQATGWNALYTVTQRPTERGVALDLSSAPGSDEIRLPQFLREEPGVRRPGWPVSPARARLALSAGPGAAAALEVEMDGVPGSHGLLELAARPDQALFDVDGVRQTAPYAAPPTGHLTLAGPGPERLHVAHAGGSGHALQVAPYGYGVGDDLWTPSFSPLPIRIGLRLPAHLRLQLRAD